MMQHNSMIFDMKIRGELKYAVRYISPFIILTYLEALGLDVTFLSSLLLPGVSTNQSSVFTSEDQ